MSRGLLRWVLVLVAAIAVAAAVYEVQYRLRRGLASVDEQPQGRQLTRARPSADAGSREGMVGVVVAHDDAVLAFKSAGKLVAVTVQVGEQVTSGQKLAELDAAESVRLVAQAKARLSSAQAELSAAWVKVRQAKDKLGRLEETAQFISQEKLESARLQVHAEAAGAEEARARVTQEKEALGMVQLTANETSLTAPFAGTVSAVLAQRGARVAPNQPVVRLVGLGDKEVRFAVPEALLNRIEEKAPLVIELSESRAISGAVVRLAPGFDPTLRYRLAEATIDAGAAIDFPAGMPVMVYLGAGTSTP